MSKGDLTFDELREARATLKKLGNKYVVPRNKKDDLLKLIGEFRAVIDCINAMLLTQGEPTNEEFDRFLDEKRIKSREEKLDDI